MDKKMLESYIPAGKEIRLLEAQMGREARRTLTDSVTGSMPEHPYTLRNMKIEGIDLEAIDVFQTLLKNLKKQRADVEVFIASVEDSHVRQILNLRYMQGMEWAQVVAHMGNNTESGVRMAADRYLKRIR